MFAVTLQVFNLRKLGFICLRDFLNSVYYLIFRKSYRSDILIHGVTGQLNKNKVKYA